MEMKIIRVILETTMLKEMKFFYHDTLELPLIRDTENFFTVQAGKTLLTFTSVAGEKRYYHIALRTNLNNFDYFFMKLESILLPDEEGRTSLYWNGRQVYFHDPEGNVIEILERKSIYGNEKSKWHDICEVGMPVSDVEDFNRWLSRIPNENSSESDTFRFYGERDFGNFVLVKEGRPWFPTDRSASIHPLTIEVEGSEYAVMKHPVLPYTITMKKR
ncbi:MAG: VOC family protein [Bacillota bacterium]|nr:VOC family protein [Bacillota bacterium]